MLVGYGRVTILAPEEGQMVDKARFFPLKIPSGHFRSTLVARLIDRRAENDTAIVDCKPAAATLTHVLPVRPGEPRVPRLKRHVERPH